MDTEKSVHLSKEITQIEHKEKNSKEKTKHPRSAGQYYTV